MVPGQILLFRPRLLQPCQYGGVGEIAVLIRIKIVNPRIGPDTILRRPHDLELTIITSLAYSAHSHVWWFFSSIFTVPCGALNS